MRIAKNIALSAILIKKKQTHTLKKSQKISIFANSIYV